MAMEYISGAQRATLQSMGLPNDNGFMKDFLGSNDKSMPLTCGFFRMEKGDPLTYKYGFDEMKLVVEGEVIVTNESGQSRKGIPGDIFYFSSGSEITFSSASCATIFYCALREMISSV